MPSETCEDHAILAAYDGSDRSSLRLADALAGALGASVHIISTYRYESEASIARGGGASARNHRRFVAATDAQHDAQRDHATGSATSVVPALRVAPSIAGVASDLDACLITVGRDRNGHVAHDVTRLADCPVVVAPADEQLSRSSLSAIGVAFDGSAGARLALDTGVTLALRTGGTLTVISCARDARHATELRADVKRQLVFRKEKPAIEHQVREGARETELRAAAQELDLLVCGSRGLGRVRERVLGSVSSSLAADPPCAVMIVPPRFGDRASALLGRPG